MPFKLKYSDAFNLASDATLTSYTGSQYVFRLNSLYDPDLTGTGHQPYGFDQYAALFNRYKVDKVTVDVIFTTPGGSYDMACLVAIRPPQNSTSLSNVFFASLSERPEVEFHHLPTTG